jgi:hypothetical protein
MRFDCGETAFEKKVRLSLWHKWFAWYPVKLSAHDCRWLEWVERRVINEFSYGHGVTIKETQYSEYIPTTTTPNYRKEN